MADLTRAPARRGRTIKRGGLGLLAMIVALVATPAALAKASNVNFVGTWTPHTGVGWTITHENRATGACSGYSAYKSSGYGLIGCHVTGRRYRFTITYGSNYRSINTGTITGNRLKGSFKDSNGSGTPYTAVRTTH